MQRKPTARGLTQFLKRARIERGLTQMEAARHLNHATSQYISNFERDMCEPSLETTIKLCELYEIPTQELVHFMVTQYEENLCELLDFKSQKSGGARKLRIKSLNR